MTRTLLLAGLLLFGGEALGHSFYSTYCCNENDCAPYEGKVVAGATGYSLPEFNVTIPYDQVQEVPFKDEYQFHLCEFPKGTVRCFYAKQGGA